MRGTQARMNRAAALRPFLPDAVTGSSIIDRRTGPVISRLLRIARDRRRSAAVAAKRGVSLWSDDPAVRFDVLFVERGPRDTWLLDESGKRVAWLGGGEVIDVATVSLRAPQPVADGSLKRLQRRLREMAIEVARRPKAKGRPAGSRDARPRLIAGYDRKTHEELAGGLRHVRSKRLWRGAAIFSNANSLAAQTIFTLKARALLGAIETRRTRLEILRRIERGFPPAK
ncbi:MAG: hypothetical protein HY725_11735 [Candidatus Rokubacteria bacterium]|nr:hypothetical protein [Candidatus Rokubacteria bacterium]